jgi:quercetin dioxygenase-like cupin family protein
VTHTFVDYRDVESEGGVHHLRGALDCSNLGVSVLDCDPGWTGVEHDHAHDGQEEVYVLVEGAATATVEGADVPLSVGEALRVDADATRRIEAGADGATLVVAASP